MVKRRIRGVVFDMDGTLIDSTECVTDSYAQAAFEAAAVKVTAEQIVNCYPLGPPLVILAALLSRETTEADEALYLKALKANEAKVQVYEGIMQLLEQLQETGVRVGVFTGASPDAAELLLSASRLREFFDVVVGTGGDIRPKPSPDGILRACELLEINPTETVYIGDSSLDLEAAKDAGVFSIAAGWGHLFAEAESTAADMLHRNTASLSRWLRSVVA